MSVRRHAVASPSFARDEDVHYEVVTRYRCKDGASIWVNTFVSAIPGGENSRPVYFATAIDITARHKAESELRRYATYLGEAERLSHTGCWARNIRTGDLFFSQEERRIFGLAPGNRAAVLSGLSRSGAS